MTENSNTVAGTARFPLPEFEAIENWRRAQPKIPTIADALRTLVALGLESEKRSAKRKKADTDGVE